MHYDVQVEQNQPNAEMPEKDDEVEEEGRGTKKEEQPQNPYAMYDDIYALAGPIDSMHNLSINLRYTSQNLSSSFDHWANKWNYQPLQ
jgi:hypothetical protein